MMLICVIQVNLQTVSMILNNRYQSVNAPRKKLIQIDSQQAHLYFSRVTESVSRDFGLYDINDRSWYYVMITWVKATGKLQLYVNSYKVHVIENYAKDEDLPE